MTYTIRIIIFSFLLSGCSILSYVSYSEAAPLIRNVVIGAPEIEITKEFFNEKEYSFAYLRVGRRASAILSLRSISNEGVYEWVSSENEKIFTYNGKVIKTHGSTYDMAYLNNVDALFSTSDDLILQLSNPHAITEQEVSFSRGDRDVMRYLDEDIEVQIDEELIFTKGFKWKIKNKYFVDVKNGYVIKVTQDIHPKLPILTIEYYYKFAD